MNKGRITFKDPDEMIRFLHDMRELLLGEEEIADDGGEATESIAENATENTDDPPESVSVKVTSEESDTPGTPARVFAKVNIPEGSPAANHVASLIKDIYGEDTEISFTDSDPTPEGYYDPERRLYHIHGEVYGEHAVIWSPIPHGSYFAVNCEFDLDEKEQPIVLPLDVTNLSRHQPRITLERDYQSAFELAKTKDEPGMVMICCNGSFYVPCTGFYNSNDDKTEYLAQVFNVKSCNHDSRHLWTMLMFQIGNLTDVFPFKFAKGTEIDWQSVMDSALENVNSDDFNPPPFKLFDDFEDSMIKSEPTAPDQTASAVGEAQKQVKPTKKSKQPKKSKKPGA